MPKYRIHTAHHTPGRMRLTVENLKNHPESLEEIRKAIAPMQGVRRVEVNAATGSVTVHYDPALYSQFHDQLRAQGKASGTFDLDPPTIGEGGEMIKSVQEEAAFLSRHSDTARTIVNVFDSLNQFVKRATDNNVDLKVLLPLGLAVYSFLEVGTEVSTPLWVTLGIFSFNSFVALHTRQDDSTSKMETEREELVVTAPSPALARPRKRKERVNAV